MRETRQRGFDLEQRRQRVFKAWSLGKNQQEIADDEKLHQGQIARDLAATLSRNHGKIGNTRRNILAMLGRIAHGESELLAAWERSKQPRERRKAKVTRGKAGKKSTPEKHVPGEVKGEDSERITEGRDGNPRFLDSLRALWELKARLLKLLTQEHSGPGGGPITVEFTPAEKTERIRYLESWLLKAPTN